MPGMYMYNQTGFTNNIFRSTLLVKIKLKKKVKTRSIIFSHFKNKAFCVLKIYV